MIERFAQIIDEAGPNGITVPAAWKKLNDNGWAPAARTTVYVWRDRLVERGDIFVQPALHGSGTMHGRGHWPAVTGKVA